MAGTEKALNAGLLAGYLAKRPPGRVTRGGIEFRVSHPDKKTMGDSGVYHDEWISGRNGGGQETILTGEGAFTRVYAGGVYPESDLVQLGTDYHSVESRLSFFIKGSGGQTRLDQDYFAVDGDWQYSYEVIERFPQIQLTTGIEKIDLKGQTVFVHLIGVSPITPRG